MPDSLPTLRTERLTLRPLADEDLDPLLAIVTAPGVREWWGSADRDDLKGDGQAFTIEVGGEVAGWLGFSEENEPDYRHAGLDISLAPAYEKVGFRPVGRLRHYERGPDGTWHDGLLMDLLAEEL